MQTKSSIEKLPTALIVLLANTSSDGLNGIKIQYPSRAWSEIEMDLAKNKTKQVWFYPENDDYSKAVVLIINKNEIQKSIKQAIEVIVNPQIINKNLFALDLIGIEENISDEELTILVRNITAGLKIGLNPMELFKSSEKEKDSSITITLKTRKEETTKSSLEQGLSYGETVNSIRALVNLPSNKKSPIEMADWMIDSGKRHGFSVEIKEKNELELEGFHALLAVNRGSEIPAKCLIAEYKPTSESGLKKIVLVGKGVTFDTGGLSIKGNQNMHYMKSDMGGAAAVMGTIEMVAKLRLPVHLIVVVPTTDNSVDAKSIKPGDVIDSYSGKTIEVIDTDAEGRLILADALSFSIQKYEPDYVIDLATLTGSVVRALGTEAAGYLTKNDALASSLEEASARSGERIWRLPLWDDYNEYLKSDIADIRNLGTKPMAGAITAGKFLETFTHKHPAWGHLDIAGTAFGNFPGSKGYAATGYGILLLTEWIKTII